MSRDEIVRTLAALIEEELAVGPLALSPETVLRDLEGWDSIAIVGVLVAIESRFGVAVNRNRLETLNRVEDLADIVEADRRRRARSS